MAITETQFRIRFPEYSEMSEYSTPRIELFLSDSVAIMGGIEEPWAGQYDRAQAYLTAHLLFLGESTELGDAGTTGKVTSKNAAGVAITFAQGPVLSADEMLLESTIYGQQYSAILRSIFVGVATF